MSFSLHSLPTWLLQAHRLPGLYLCDRHVRHGHIRRNDRRQAAGNSANVRRPWNRLSFQNRKQLCAYQIPAQHYDRVQRQTHQSQLRLNFFRRNPHFCVHESLQCSSYFR
jgi:hypothetical protein